MARKTSPELEAQAAAMLAAGWPMTAVAEETGLTYRTVRRIKERSGVEFGEDKAALIDAARERLSEALGGEFARTESARLVRCQSALCHSILDHAERLLAGLEPDAPETDKLRTAKVLSAVATASKLAADSLRQVLSLAASPDREQDLPSLEIREMLEEEVAAVREAQRRQGLEMGVSEEML